MNTKTQKLTKLAMLLCILCILAQIKLDIGLVPITLQTLGIYLISLLVKPKYATLIALAYVFMGAIGLPVFSGFSGGLGALLGPAGGYIYAFPVMAYVTSLLGFNKSILQKVIACFAGTVVCYTIGTAWFMHVTQMDLMSSLGACVFPFLLGDGLKIVLSIVLSQRITLKNLD